MIHSTRGLRGFTLIELLFSMVLLGILLAVAVPSVVDMVTRSRLKGAAEELFLNLQWARSEAIKQNTNFTVSIRTGAAWCYGFNAGAAFCDCSVAGACTKAINPRGGASMSLATNFPAAGGGNIFTFDATGIPSNAGTATLTPAGAAAPTAVVSVNAIGRIGLTPPP